MKEMFPQVPSAWPINGYPYDAGTFTCMHMTISLCNFHQITFYLPFHTSPPVFSALSMHISHVLWVGYM